VLSGYVCYAQGEDMALTARGLVEQQKQPQRCPKELSSNNVTHERVGNFGTESRPAGQVF